MSNERECEDTVAFVLIKTELGQAQAVAQEVSARYYEDEEGFVRGVRWADVITGPYDVLAAVRVADNTTLGEFVVNEIQTVDGVRNPGTVVMTTHYVKGGAEPLGHNGHP